MSGQKTVKRIVTAAVSGEQPPARWPRSRDYDDVAALVAAKVDKTHRGIRRSGSRPTRS
jgi:hypothetical protein